METYRESDAYWVGSLAMTCALAYRDLRRNERAAAQENLKRVLEDFLRSPVPVAEVRRTLREEMRR